ncbi:MAG: phosphoribosylamine--glycine ligase [Candidatus Omnitrophica bacterium]|nr:phosphoribosylamine--glycine ligase [Candidatus Omnitrophota bacterium]MBU4487727.1 phosphoribosylamine--glycine ligase [Candidatus Omnitrophota bacterium]MCG2705267.1 phosphoribosylamine--glycine ligase [Candidatus Omnitrophota bacterium]
MRVLVIGSGGREHALCWKIAQSEKVDKVYSAPGNGGISKIAEIADIKADDINGLLKFAKAEKIGLTVIGPEAPLVAGIVDIFEKEGLKIFGPSGKVAALEGSKVFAKEAMKRFGVPTADFEVFLDYEKAKAYIEGRKLPIVIKADGLAQGKGVTVAHAREEALSALKSAMVEKVFGKAGERVVIEECLVGEEASIIVVSDGKNIVSMATSQDHKRINDGDKGPNTGGMGAYSPTPLVAAEIEKRIMDEVIHPMIVGLAKDNMPYKGVLYAGIMLTKNGPKTLEFNVRFGDPETQAILPRLRSDLVELMERSISGDLKGYKAVWYEKSAVCVVLTSGGYPASYEKGKEIHGLENAEKLKDVVVFHAGTKKSSGTYVTDGGRVLGVTGLADDIELAIHAAYNGVSKIKFDKMHFRRDIGKKALCGVRPSLC